MREKDWASTPLGPPQQWPHSLRTAVRIILTSRYPMFIWWGEERINLYNDPYSPFLGTKHPAALGRPAREAWGEIWSEVGPRSDAVLLRGESTFDQGLQLMMKRHGYIEETYFTFSYSPLPDDDGNIGGIFCAVTEETQRVIGERRLRFLRKLAFKTSEARTPASVIEAVTHCLGDADKDLPFALLYLRDAGGSLRRVANIGIAASHPAAPDSMMAESDDVWPRKELLASGHGVVVSDLGERFRDLPTGAWNVPPTNAMVVPLAEQGQTRSLGVLIVGTNPHREIDEELTGFVDLIAGQIAAAFANANAYVAERKRAEALAELDRAKTIFFSNVSHEFRTPLTLMLGPLEDLIGQSPARVPDEARQELEIVHRNSIRLLKLVNALLDFSRIEAGRVDAWYEPVDIGAFTAELASVFRSAMERAGLRYSVHCDAKSDLAYLDREMWEKVVFNLLSNALKFTLSGEVEVSIRSSDGHAELKVRDTGSGIPESELPRIFDRFHRVEGAIGRTHEGTGIGLALVDELVRLHGGRVHVESTPGKGTTFTVTIPLGSQHLPVEKLGRARPTALGTPESSPYVQEALRWLPDAKPAERSSTNGDSANEDLTDIFPGQETTPSSPLGTVLLADDNRDMREYVERILSRRYRVITAADGRQALELAREHAPDLILTDVMMPRMDGFALLRALRQDAQTITVPVVMLSARAGEESRVEGMEGGADDYLVKPFTARELMARVNAHVAMKRLREELTHREHNERKRAEHAEAQYRRILESISEGFLFVDSDWTIRYVNSVYAGYARSSEEQLVGRNLWEAFPETGDTAFGTIYRDAMVNQKEAEIEDYYEPLDAWFHVHLYPTNDGLAMFVADVTTERRQQQALLVSEKLAAAGRLASTVAHEINNPLESVVNLLYLARRANTPEQADQYLDFAEREINRVSHIARQTLGFYRETAQMTRVPLQAIVDALLQVYQGKFKAKTIDVRTDVAPDLQITARTGELNQVLSNLITNALDACSAGGRVEIQAKTRRQEDIAGAEITVTDNGSGIHPDDLPRVFEPFFTTKKDVGTGLGLWVVKQIVEGSSGTLAIESSTDPESHGTTVTLFLPEAAGAKAQGASPSTSAA